MWSVCSPPPMSSIGRDISTHNLCSTPQHLMGVLSCILGTRISETIWHGGKQIVSRFIEHVFDWSYEIKVMMKYTGTVIRNLFYCLDQVFKTRFPIFRKIFLKISLSLILKILLDIYFFVGHINNLYNTCFWKLVQERGLTPAQSQEKLKVSRGVILKVSWHVLYHPSIFFKQLNKQIDFLSGHLV